MPRTCTPLGFLKSFPVSFRATLAGVLGKNRRILLPLGGDGTVLLFFQATHDPNVLAVRVEDIRFRLLPFSVTLPDIDRPVEIQRTLLGRHVFDLDACNGQLHVGSKEFTLNLRLTLTHDVFPQLALVGIHAPVAVHIVERGHLDLSKNTIDARAARFHASGDVMRSLVVHPGQSDQRSALDYNNDFTTPEGFIAAKGVVGTQTDRMCESQGAKELLICPGTPVTLCWKSEGTNPRFGPAGQSPTGIQQSGTTQVTPAAATQYDFAVDSTNTDKDGNVFVMTDDVRVAVVTSGMSHQMVFGPNPWTGVWEQDISEFIADPKILVREMVIEPCADNTVLFNALTVVYTPPPSIGGSSRSFNIFAANPQPIGVPLVGNWKLSIGGHTEGVRGQVCVSAILNCR